MRTNDFFDHMVMAANDGHLIWKANDNESSLSSAMSALARAIDEAQEENQLVKDMAVAACSILKSVLNIRTISNEEKKELEMKFKQHIAEQLS